MTKLVSVPDYGELILNLYLKRRKRRQCKKVSVPDYGELILNLYNNKIDLDELLKSFRPRLRGTNLKLIQINIWMR